MAADVLDRLEAALIAERDALRGQDAEALTRTTDAKIAALRAVEAQGPLVARPGAERLRHLAQINRENGILLARRRRAVTFALRQLGHSDTSSYTVRGHYASTPVRRVLATA